MKLKKIEGISNFSVIGFYFNSAFVREHIFYDSSYVKFHEFAFWSGVWYIFDVFLCLHEDDNMCLLLWGRICKYQFGQISCQCFPVLFMLKAFYLYLYGWWREAMTSLFVIVDFHFSVLLVSVCVYWHFFVECSNLGFYVTLRFEKQFLKLCVFFFLLYSWNSFHPKGLLW